MFKLHSTLRTDEDLKGTNKLVFDLQMFADGEGNTGDSAGAGGEEDKSKETKTYSKEEVDKLLQSETDKRVTEALKTSRAKWESEYQEKLEKEKEEVERLSKLSAKEKEEELRKQKEKELAEKETALRLRELQLDTIGVLSDEELPVGFADFLIKDDAETTKSNISKFKTEWQKAIAKAVDEKLKGNSPRKPGTTLGDDPVKTFMEMANEANIRNK